MTEKLKPCPFCGCKHIAVFGGTHILYEEPYRFECHDCGCVLYTIHRKEDKAIVEWNRRINDESKDH